MRSASFRSRLRRPGPHVWIAGAAFLGALLARSVWLPDAFFHPDESTVLWMALDAVRDPQIPDHGLISSYHVFQPPGLVWVTMPWIAFGGGRPEVVIVGFALLNASGIALLVGTVARSWGLVYAAVLGGLLVIGPDAFFSTWVWHVSLYTAAVALMMTAGIRLREGSAWSAFALVMVPGAYSLIHYSGLVLFAPALVLLLRSRRKLRSLAVPVLSGVVLVVCAWGPFLSFQVDREWQDVERITEATGTSSSIGSALDDRYEAFVFAVSHLGHSRGSAVHLTGYVAALALVAFLIALIRRRWREPGFAVPAAVLASGLAAQVALGQGERGDVLMLWHVPLYALAAWAVVQLIEVSRLAVAHRAVAPAFAVGVVLLVTVVGVVDLSGSIDDTPDDQTLAESWNVARAGTPVQYFAADDPTLSENKYYLPCDPPYDWDSQIWYLREVLDPGAGRTAALEAGAFRSRAGTPCTLQER